MLISASLVFIKREDMQQFHSPEQCLDKTIILFIYIKNIKNHNHQNHSLDPRGQRPTPKGAAKRAGAYPLVFNKLFKVRRIFLNIHMLFYSNIIDMDPFLTTYHNDYGNPSGEVTIER